MAVLVELQPWFGRHLRNSETWVECSLQQPVVMFDDLSFIGQ